MDSLYDTKQLFVKLIFYHSFYLINYSFENQKARLMLIGQAGERGVKFASILDDDERNAGRTGMGAVMGSKNLKAIMVDGNKKLEVAKQNELNDYSKKLVENMEKNLLKKIMVDNYKKFGTSALFGISHLMRNLGVKNWQLRFWQPHVKISGQELRKKYFEKHLKQYFSS